MWWILLSVRSNPGCFQTRTCTANWLEEAQREGRWLFWIGVSHRNRHSLPDLSAVFGTCTACCSLNMLFFLFPDAFSPGDKTMSSDFAMLVALSARAWTVYPWEVGSYWCWIQGKKREYHVRSRFSLTCIYHSSLLRTWRVGLVMLGSRLILRLRYFGSFAWTRIKTDMSQAYIREKELAKSMPLNEPLPWLKRGGFTSLPTWQESAQYFNDAPKDPSHLLQFQKRWPAFNASAAFQHNHKDLLPQCWHKYSVELKPLQLNVIVTVRLRDWTSSVCAHFSSWFVHFSGVVPCKYQQRRENGCCCIFRQCSRHHLSWLRLVQGQLVRRDIWSSTRRSKVIIFELTLAEGWKTPVVDAYSEWSSKHWRQAQSKQRLIFKHWYLFLKLALILLKAKTTNKVLSK